MVTGILQANRASLATEYQPINRRSVESIVTLLANERSQHLDFQ